MGEGNEWKGKRYSEGKLRKDIWVGIRILWRVYFKKEIIRRIVLERRILNLT